MPHAFRQHGVEEAEAVDEVVAEIELRLRHRLADIGKGGEMHDGGDLVLAQGGPEPRRIREIGLDERPPADRPAVPVDEIVVTDGNEAGGGQGLAGMAADIAGAAGDENLLWHGSNRISARGWRGRRECVPSADRHVFRANEAVPQVFRS